MDKMEDCSKDGSDAVLDNVKEQHQQLASIIKGLHKQLRREYREHGGDYSSVWERHAQDTANLQRYAQAMLLLATQHWAVHPDTRIQWCRRAALDYYTGGGMRRALEKDARRRMHHGQSKAANCENPKVGSNLASQPRASQESNSNAETAPADCHKQEKSDLCQVAATAANVDNTMPQVTPGRLRLLDVGSCYDPFQECPEFDSLGIDLSPATKSVYQCDFLKLEVTSTSMTTFTSEEPLTSALGLDPDPRTGPIERLPGGSFHVVVFSLLLEYMPAAAQRWACCRTAHALLARHGLLVIVTPDSNSENRNAPMIKSWRQALEYLGFVRWRYQKLEHVHCMAYRKVNDPPPAPVPESVQKLLYIPQDFSDACYLQDHLPSQASDRGTSGNDLGGQSEEVDNFLLSSMGELPLLSFDSDDDDADKEGEKT